MEIRTEIEIDAPVARVWRVLTDFGSYPQWNPFIVSLEGELRPGSRLRVTLSLPESNKEQVFRPRLLKCEENAELRWLGHLWMKGLFDGEHFFRLHARDAQHTRFVHGEDFSGVLLKLGHGAITQAARGFVYMNQALKRRVETAHPGHA